MSFPFNFYLAAFVGAFLATLLALPLWRKWCLRTNLVDDPGHRKIHSTPVPLAGGLAVMTGLAVPLVAAVLVAVARTGLSHWMIGSNAARLDTPRSIG